MNSENFISLGNKVLETELAAVQGLKQYLDQGFANACQAMFDCCGKVVVVGMGKSGHIGGKIAATLASTGTPAFFVHPGEASHGDLGMISEKDVVLAISNSGETGELLAIIPVIKRIGTPLIAMTGNPQSTLATLAEHHVCVKVEQEACPLGLAPTSSTTATLVMGDAIAVALLNARGFTADDFALSHPGGSLGKRLLLRLSDIMHTGDRLPVVSTDALIKDALVEMSEKGLGMTAVCAADGKLAGIFTDGDLRRILEGKVDIHSDNIVSVMTQTPTTAQAELLAAEALNVMEEKKINGLIVVDEHNQPVGALNLQDLLKSGVL
ncbi:KpsF/GutQ family sugar-phosphate isomerase [Thalassotalea euphylliae]|uniref:Arabinose 5-phosphate isomerase n=1 Tax=Thalassotalea euphylliae TaxID=1655234 RepID=A0A3E0TM70_9GAMM|nr:KpsF/GutQ family sugar-phosphate isomerase [Thalassotalea euphylliae]REL25651.1 KpsF/GutQ family sugar-phosphate isomerase [Thalassotalea euphylliae]